MIGVVVFVCSLRSHGMKNTRTIIRALAALPSKKRNMVIESLDKEVLRSILHEIVAMSSDKKSVKSKKKLSEYIDYSDPDAPLTRARLPLSLVGAGVGATGSLGMWAVKRIGLSRKLKRCSTLPPDEVAKCRFAVKEEIRKLRERALAAGVLTTAGGAALGAATPDIAAEVNRRADAAHLRGKKTDMELRAINAMDDVVKRDAERNRAIKDRFMRLFSK